MKNKDLFNNSKFVQQKILNEKTHTNYWFNSNKEILISLWKTFAIIRINKWLKQEDVSDMTWLSISTIRRFESWKTIALDSFIRLMKSIWNITDIDNLLVIKNNKFDVNRKRI
jgi:hypothetical protein